MTSGDNQILKSWERSYISKRKFPNLNIIDLEVGGSESKIKAIQEINAHDEKTLQLLYEQ